MKQPLRLPLPKNMLVYGLLLALIVLAAEWLEFQFFLKRYSLEFYVLIFGVLFTAIGIWIGYQLTHKSPLEVTGNNQSALTYLGISEREQGVLQLLVAGHSNQEIADELCISTNTVKSHLKSLYQKLEVKRRGQAVEKARKLQLIIPKA